MTGIDSGILERLLARLAEGFPLSESPYCDLGEELGAGEMEVLDAVLELRECGMIGRIAAEFVDLEGFLATAADDDVDLAVLVGTDLPSGEHPYDELAAQLQLRGVDRTSEWVRARLAEWVADGTVTKIAAEVA